MEKPRPVGYCGWTRSRRRCGSPTAGEELGPISEQPGCCPECELLALEDIALEARARYANTGDTVDHLIGETAAERFWELYDELGFDETDWTIRL